MAKKHNLPPTILDAVDQVNDRQKNVLMQKVDEHYSGSLSGLRFAVWGLAFKPKTDDIRESPALVLIDQLLEKGASVCVFDPEAAENVRADYGDRVEYADQAMDALEGANALAINTEWDMFRHPEFEEMKSKLESPVIFDGRNLYDPAQMAALGFTYYSIGRPPVGDDAIAEA